MVPFPSTARDFVPQEMFFSPTNMRILFYPRTSEFYPSTELDQTIIT